MTVWEDMQYPVCPRCKFQMTAVKKHLCLTCGYKLPREDHTAAGSASLAPASSSPLPNTPHLWSKLFKWEFEARASEKVEPTQEKPALS